jgi:hypothetical protein
VPGGGRFAALHAHHTGVVVAVTVLQLAKFPYLVSCSCIRRRSFDRLARRKSAVRPKGRETHDETDEAAKLSLRRCDTHATRLKSGFDINGMENVSG